MARPHRPRRDADHRRPRVFRRRRKDKSPRRQLPKAAVPSFFTLMNLFSGFLALTQIYEGRFEYACWLIVLAGFFDALDGLMARLTGAVSLFGVELDSLSDIVSFGVAPAFLVYVFGLYEFNVLGIIVASLPAICGAVRLARFNVTFEGDKKPYFVGMPIPVQAITIVALILNINDAEWFSTVSMNNLSLLIPIVIVLSALMVSNVPFESMPKPSPVYIRQHPWKMTLYTLGALLIVFLQQIGLLIALSVYILHAIGRAATDLGRAVLNASTEEH